MRQFLFSKSGLVLLGFLGISSYFLWTEHEAHVIAALPWLLVGGCLLMHLFMHGGHGGHSGGTAADSHDDESKGDGQRAP